MRQINKKQIQLIHIAKIQLGLSDEEYRSILMERYRGCFGSCKDLSYDEATDLINYFKTLGFKITKRYKRRELSPNVIALVSEQQLRLIEHLKADIRWHVHDGFYRWIKAFLKKDKIITSKDAFKVIEALKAMKARQQKALEPGAECYKDGCIKGRGYWKW